jgi:hypothetical protein
VRGRESSLRTFVGKLLGVVLEVGLYLGKVPSKSILLTSVLSRYLELSFTGLVDYKLKLSVLYFERSDPSSKLL